LIDRDIVLASHLKPLDKSDNIGQCFKQTWNVSTLKTDDNATIIQSQNSEVTFSHVYNVGIIHDCR